MLQKHTYSSLGRYYSYVEWWEVRITRAKAHIVWVCGFSLYAPLLVTLFHHFFRRCLNFFCVLQLLMFFLSPQHFLSQASQKFFCPNNFLSVLRINRSIFNLHTSQFTEQSNFHSWIWSYNHACQNKKFLKILLDHDFSSVLVNKKNLENIEFPLRGRRDNIQFSVILDRQYN